MIRMSLSVAAIALLGTAALAQTPPARPDPAVNGDRPAMGPVSPLQAPDASTQPGQERGNREITNKSTTGTDRTSKPGTPGLPGSKSGPTATERGTGESSGSSTNAPLQDQSKVPGMKGGKSGPSAK